MASPKTLLPNSRASRISSSPRAIPVSPTKVSHPISDRSQRSLVCTIILQENSNLTLSQVRSMVPFSREEYVSQYLEQLRQAGVPE